MTLWTPTRLLRPWDSPGKSTEVGCHALLQGIFLTQGLTPHLLCLLHVAGFFTTVSLVAQIVKRLPAVRETQGQSLGHQSCFPLIVEAEGIPKSLCKRQSWDSNLGQQGVFIHHLLLVCYHSVTKSRPTL